ncbi:site-2 protease family protein [Phycisphaerales bacterium AB-hyl4]|uniref:Zinc metalloprotease n=1 Tax=Natronomicrosphaera hydrolytica TaxID=3242702 RepID=A0ABV4U3M1_9BACT
MFGPRFHILNLFGFPIYVDLSWFIIVVLITWSLAEGLFGAEQWYPELADEPTLRWAMGFAGAIGLFVSVVLHELGHAKVAEWFGVPMKGITLFIFGGVAEMTQEPPSAKAEFWVAIAGPIVSVAVGCTAAVLWGAGHFVGLGVPFTSVIGYLAIINIVLVVFNMIPAFPLDGGRVLRSIIWAWSGQLNKATRVTSQIGSGFGIALMILAVLRLIMGDILGAVWWFLIGMFLRAAAQMSYQRLLARRALEGETLERFMKQNPVTLNVDVPIDRVVDDFLYRYNYKMFPVVEDGDRVVGCITINQIKALPREKWEQTRVSDVYEPCDDTNTIQLDKDPLDALTAMSQTQRSRLIVLEGDRLVGIVSLKDLMDFLSMKIELEEVR